MVGTLAGGQGSIMTQDLRLDSSPELVSNWGGRPAGDESGAHDATPGPSRQPIPAEPAEAAPGMAPGRLRAHDQILIHTRQGTYVFLVTDPAKHFGLVVGGLFGNYAARAVLGVLPAAHDHRLRVGARAVFRIESSAGSMSVTTSVITQLTYRPAS